MPNVELDPEGLKIFNDLKVKEGDSHYWKSRIPQKQSHETPPLISPKEKG